MIPAAFAYHRPESLDEALALLARYGDDAKLLAGGHSLIPMMKLRFVRPPALIDIARLPGLAGITERDGGFAVGAATLHRDLAASAALARRAPALSDAANGLGDVQVRNRGTAGGACAHADPAADYPAVMLALDATMTIAGPRGTRSVPAERFFVGMFETALAADEILTGIAFDAAPASAYAKFPHPASGYAVVGVASRVRVESGRIAEVRLAATGVSPEHVRLQAAEDRLRGVAAADEDALDAACAGAADGVETHGDHYASAEYRTAMCDVFTRRALRAALRRASEG